MIRCHDPLQILVWADKLALQSGKVQKRDADNKWRLKAADAVAMHCLHELKVRLLTCWPFLQSVLLLLQLCLLLRCMY